MGSRAKEDVYKMVSDSAMILILNEGIEEQSLTFIGSTPNSKLEKFK
jgi:hypothetical protein